MTTEPAFAVWITGLPASGKSSISQALVQRLAERGVDVAVLESDVLRPILTPNPTYGDDERKQFYRAMAYIGGLLIAHGVPVVFDATANRRAYRDHARATIARFVEVFVDSPPEVCAARDPKGLYRMASAGGATRLPGVQTAYEPPEQPDLTVSGWLQPARAMADEIVRLLERRAYIPIERAGAPVIDPQPGPSAPASGSTFGR